MVIETDTTDEMRVKELGLALMKAEKHLRLEPAGASTPASTPSCGKP
jgi:hypothetical protein